MTGVLRNVKECTGLLSRFKCGSASLSTGIVRIVCLIKIM